MSYRPPEKPVSRWGPPLGRGRRKRKYGVSDPVTGGARAPGSHLQALIQKQFALSQKERYPRR